MSEAPARLIELVQRFSANIDAYKHGTYKEAQLRQEFINPFFEELGWDVRNTQGFSETYKDVIHEDAIKVGRATKAPDYCFRVGGARTFFIEAKSPAVNISESWEAAYQLRRYAWSAKLRLSILTNFEELAIYDCRIKPSATDKAGIARIRRYHFTEYAEKWEEIAAIFSKESVLKGSFDRFAESTKLKKGTAEVDDSFLKEIETWRDELAKSIASRNPYLAQKELNFAVQKTIDRIVFLRICEDRGIEMYGRLMGLLNGEEVYKRLCEYYRQADDKYNSGLFHFKPEPDRNEEPDKITFRLTIDDKTLKEIIQKLYYPQSPYEFSVLSADILGHVYEQFLGKVIRLTDTHQAKVEEKPEVRKAGGVYYTPTYIVDYIVKNTIGKCLAGKSPKYADELKILDPACGSGSFLIGAYQYLLDWYRGYYLNHGPEKYAKGSRSALFKGNGDWKLTTFERKRILLNNIFGVDIDHQAVEVTKLSLLLKVLEGEKEETINNQLRLFKERALPDLGNNIKCGNSLIGHDFYENYQMNLLGEEEALRINVFDWHSEFQEIFKNDGFSIVIGNPPYVRQEGLGEYKEYFQKHYQTYDGVADLYTYFIEKSFSLLKPGGYLSIIVSNKWMRANYGVSLRGWLKEKRLEEIVDFGDLPVFTGVTTYPCIIRVKKETANAKFNVAIVKTLDFKNLIEYVEKNSFPVKQKNLSEKGLTLTRNRTQSLLTRLQSKGIPLGEYVEGKIYRGVLTGLNEAFVIDKKIRNRLIKEDPKSKEIIKPFLIGRNIKRYQIPVSEKYLIFTRRGIDIKKYPAIKEYLSQFRQKLRPKPDNWKGKKWRGRKPGSYKWYEIQDTIGYYPEFAKPKIILPDIAKESRMSFDVKGLFLGNTGYIIPINDLFLLGILNSKLISFYYKNISSSYRGGYVRFIFQYLAKIPIPIINFSDRSDKFKHDRIVNLVEAMIKFHQRLAEVKTEHETNALKRQIEATDAQIDGLVYELYGLNQSEIKIIEEALNQ